MIGSGRALWMSVPLILCNTTIGRALEKINIVLDLDLSIFESV